MVVLSSLSSAAAASPKKKLKDLSAIELNEGIVGAILSLWLADTVIQAIKPGAKINDKDKLELAKTLAPIVKGAMV